MKNINICNDTIFYKVYLNHHENKTNYIKISEEITPFFKNKISIIKDSFKKPYILDNSTNNIYPFSISHSKNCLVYCFSLNNSIDIGLDIEEKIPKENVIKRICSASEKTYIEKNSISTKDVWMQKEAISKAFGSGIYMGLSNLDISKKSLFGKIVTTMKIKDEKTSFYITTLNEKVEK